MSLPRLNDQSMTAESFIAWSEAQAGDARHELLDGEIFAMASERVAHARVKANAYVALQSGLKVAGIACEAFPDGMAVRVSDHTVFEPDALVRCGPPLADDVVLVVDPIIVVEVASPSTQRLDALMKFKRYFDNPAILHYLIVVPSGRTVIHHARRDDGGIETRGHDDGGLVTLDPPGVTLDVADFFANVGK